MAELVGDDIDIFAVSADHGGCYVGVDGVLHASVGEAGGQDEEIILFPLVWFLDDFLELLDVVFRVLFEFPLGGVEGFRACGYSAARSDWSLYYGAVYVSPALSMVMGLCCILPTSYSN